MDLILAIDPGPVKTAWVLYNPESTEPIVNFGHQFNQELLDHLFEINVENYVKDVVIEMIASYGMPVGREVFETCVWIGRIAENLRVKCGLSSKFMYRKDIKVNLCGSVRAKDGNIRQALIDLLGPQGTKKNPGPTYGVSGDVWAALAVAVAFHKEQEWGKKAEDYK